MKQIYIKTRNEWRSWLQQNHQSSSGVWLIFYKKHIGKPSLKYDEVVEEALCFGWIDSIIKKIDEERYVRKFTPRKLDSRWSDINKKRVLKLEKQGLMTEAGRAVVEAARESGFWDKPDRPALSFEVPDDLKDALAKNRKAKMFFDRLAPSYKKQFLSWIQFAKRRETRENRIRESIALLEQGEKLGMK